MEYLNLQKIATSTNHLIHSQEMKTIVKEISSQLCSKNGVPEHKTFPPSSIPPEAGVVENPKSTQSKSMKKEDAFVSETDAYRNSPLLLRDETITSLKNGGVRTQIVPSTIAFMGQPRHMKTEKFKNTKLSDQEIHSIAQQFWKSSRNDSIIELDEDGQVIGGMKGRDHHYGTNRAGLDQLESLVELEFEFGHLLEIQFSKAF